MSLKRMYEVMFILAPNTEEEETDKIIAQLSQGIAEKGGEVAKVEKMGNRQLAYEIRKGSRKFRDGYYVLLHVNGNGGEIAETERRLRVFDPVIRYLTVRIDEELKRAKKIQDRRAARQSARAQQRAGDSGEGGERNGGNDE